MTSTAAAKAPSTVAVRATSQRPRNASHITMRVALRPCSRSLANGPTQRRPASQLVTYRRNSVSVCASTADVRTICGDVSGTGLKIAIVTARFNSLVTKALLEGCVETLLSNGVAPDDVVSTWVPGAFELGVVSKNIASSGTFDAVICLGAIIRGDTSHYDAVVGAATSGVQSAGAATGVPCIFGVLTTDNMDQALNRCGGKAGNIGSNAAATAIETANLLSKLKAEGMAS